MQKLESVDSNSKSIGIRGSRAGPQRFTYDSPGEVFINHVTRQLEPSRREEESLRLREELERAIVPTTGYRHLASSTTIHFSTPKLPDLRREELQQAFIASLYYYGMGDRQYRIAEAHEKTFRWIFTEETNDSQKWACFTDWLESDSQLYWITGKAGSGKSTLMKFITQYEVARDGSITRIKECGQYLSKWAANRRLIVASFYFWAAGSFFDTAHRGLYQSLLYQIFRQCPDLISRATPNLWEVLCLLNKLPPDALTEEELRLILMEVVEVAKLDHKICFFIDELDEFDGKPEDLLGLLQNLLRFPNIKLCVASRPWVIFEDSFAHRPSLMLQDLTYRDIMNFITSTLSGDAGFRRLQYRESEYANGLIRNIATKASGVFLWVQLVVKSLLTGMGNDDRISDLQRRLDLLPPDLERLYDAILDTLDPFYFERAAQYFRLMGAWKGPPSALMFSFADEDENFGLVQPIGQISEDTRKARIDTVRRRINSRCKGLLEITDMNLDSAEPQAPADDPESLDYDLSPYRVQYLHKSVKEYIEAPGMAQKLDSAVGNFDCYLRLCSAYLFLTKTLPLASMSAVKISQLAKIVRTFLEYAAKVSPTEEKTMLAHIDEIHRILTQELRKDLFEEFYDIAIRTTTLDQWIWRDCDPGVSSLIVRAGIVPYVRARIGHGALTTDSSNALKMPDTKQKAKRRQFILRKFKSKQSVDFEPQQGWPLLLDALISLPLNLEMFVCLLDRGADPNFALKKSATTIWIEVLHRAVSDCFFLADDMTDREEKWRQWTPIIQTFFDHGATVTKEVYTKVIRRTDGEIVGKGRPDHDKMYQALVSLKTGDENGAVKHLREGFFVYKLELMR